MHSHMCNIMYQFVCECILQTQIHPLHIFKDNGTVSKKLQSGETSNQDAYPAFALRHTIGFNLPLFCPIRCCSPSLAMCRTCAGLIFAAYWGYRIGWQPFGVEFCQSCKCVRSLNVAPQLIATKAWGLGQRLRSTLSAFPVGSASSATRSPSRTTGAAASANSRSDGAAEWPQGRRNRTRDESDFLPPGGLGTQKRGPSKNATQQNTGEKNLKKNTNFYKLEKKQKKKRQKKTCLRSPPPAATLQEAGHWLQPNWQVRDNGHESQLSGGEGG